MADLSIFRRSSAQDAAADVHHERGATMLEYALMAACIAIVAVAGVSALGLETKETFRLVQIKLANSSVVGPDPG